ncbi:MAG: hypothetical protein AAGG38_15045 [Planctomycetota bacterium]
MSDARIPEAAVLLAQARRQLDAELRASIGATLDAFADCPLEELTGELVRAVNRAMELRSVQPAVAYIAGVRLSAELMRSHQEWEAQQ